MARRLFTLRFPTPPDLRTSTVTVSNYTGPSSSYRANVEWDIVTKGAPVAANADASPPSAVAAR